MRNLSLLIGLLLVASFPRDAVALPPGPAESASSKYPLAIEPKKVGRYPALVKSGGGYFYDDVLEYRVWVPPGAKQSEIPYWRYEAFARFEDALKSSIETIRAERPRVVIRQRKWINEPQPGVFEIVEEERIAEWQVAWLDGRKRESDSLEQFMQDHKRK